MTNKLVIGSAAALVGLFATPYILQLLSIPQGTGFGVDDVVTALVIATALVMLPKLIG